MLNLFKKKEKPPKKTAIMIQNGDDVKIHSFTGQPVTKYDLMSLATKISGQKSAVVRNGDSAVSGVVTVDAIPFDQDTAPFVIQIMNDGKPAKQTPDPDWAVQMFPDNG